MKIYMQSCLWMQQFTINTARVLNTSAGMYGCKCYITTICMYFIVKNMYLNPFRKIRTDYDMKVIRRQILCHVVCVPGIPFLYSGQNDNQQTPNYNSESSMQNPARREDSYACCKLPSNIRVNTCIYVYITFL